MQSMFDTVETENQLSFAEKLHFRVITAEYSVENRVVLVIYCVHTDRQETRQMKKLIACAFNMDTICVELKFSNSSMIDID